MVGVGVGRFLDRIAGIGWLLGRIGSRMAVEQFLGGQTRIRRVIVFLRLGLFVIVRSLVLLG